MKPTLGLLLAILNSWLVVLPWAANAQYEFLSEWGSEGTNAAEFVIGPGDIAIDTNDKVYLTDIGTHQVKIFSSEGAFISLWTAKTNSAPLFATPEAIAIDSSNRVYACQSWRNESTIFIFDAQGNFLTNLLQLGSAPGQVDTPGQIRFDSSGNLIVRDDGNDRIQKFDPNGNFVLQFGSDGTADDQFQGMGGVGVDLAGNIYVTDLMGNAVKKFSPSGQFLTRWEGANGGFDTPTGITVDKLGNVVVSDSRNHRIQVFKPDGQFVGEFTHLAGPSGPFEPYLSAVDSAGNLYVIDSANSRIVKFRLGPHGWWKFNEGGGSIATNSGIHGVEGNATLTNGVTFSADTPNGSGSSIALPASSTGATTPAVQTSSSYDPLAGATKFTISAWVKRESGSNSSNTAARIVSDINSLGTTASGFEFRFSGTNGVLTVNINGTERSTTAGAIPPTDGAWRHVAVVYDGTRPATNTLTRHVHFYVDGVQRGDGNTLAGATVGSNTNKLTIGNSAIDRSVLNTLVGKIDNVRIYRDFAPDAVGNGKTNSTIISFQNQ